MNSKTTSILALVCRIGKMIGALFTIIGLLVLIGTISGLTKPKSSNSYSSYYGYDYGWNSMEFSDGAFGGSSREYMSSTPALSAAYSSYGSSDMAQVQALSSISGSLNFMCAGAFVMFFSAIGAFIFDLISKKNKAGGLIDLAVGLMAFITNFIVTPSTSNIMSIGLKISSGDYSVIVGYFAALLLLVMSAFLMLRSAFPGTALLPKKNNSASGPVQKRPIYQQPVYAQNQAYQNQYPNGAQNQYQNGGYNNGVPGGRV